MPPPVYDDSDLKAKLAALRGARNAGEGWWDWANRPRWEAPAKLGRQFEEWITEPTLEDQTTTSNIGGFGPYGKAMAKGLIGGSVRGLGEVVSGFTSPLNIATTAATMGTAPLAARGLTGAANLAAYGAKGLGTVQALHGGGEIAGAASDLANTGDWRAAAKRAGHGGMELAGGALGMHTPIPGARPAAPPLDLATPTQGRVPAPRPAPPFGPSGATGTQFYPQPRPPAPAPPLQLGEVTGPPVPPPGPTSPTSRTWGTTRVSPQMWMGQEPQGFTVTRAGITTPENPVQGVIEVGGARPASAGMGGQPTPSRAAFEALVPRRYQTGTSYDPSIIRATPTLGDISGPPTPGLPTLSERGNLLRGQAGEAAARRGQPTVGIDDMVERYGIEETARRANMTPEEVRAYTRGEGLLGEVEAPAPPQEAPPPAPMRSQRPPQAPRPPQAQAQRSNVQGMSNEVVEALANRGNAEAVAEVTRREGIRAGRRSRQGIGSEQGSIVNPAGVIIDALRSGKEGLKDIISKGKDYFAGRVKQLMTDETGAIRFNLSDDDIAEAWRRLQRAPSNTVGPEYAVSSLRGHPRGTPGLQKAEIHPEDYHTTTVYRDSSGKPIIAAELTQLEDGSWGINSFAADPNVTGLGMGRAMEKVTKHLIEDLGVRGAHESISGDTRNYWQKLLMKQSGKSMSELNAEMALRQDKPIQPEVSKWGDDRWFRDLERRGIPRETAQKAKEFAKAEGIDWTTYDDLERLGADVQKAKANPLGFSTSEKQWYQQAIEGNTPEQTARFDSLVRQAHDLGISLRQDIADEYSLSNEIRNANRGGSPAAESGPRSMEEEISASRQARQQRRSRFREEARRRENPQQTPRQPEPEVIDDIDTASDDYYSDLEELPDWEPETGRYEGNDPNAVRAPQHVRFGDARNMDPRIEAHIEEGGGSLDYIRETLQTDGIIDANDMYDAWVFDYLRRYPRAEPRPDIGSLHQPDTTEQWRARMEQNDPIARATRERQGFGSERGQIVNPAGVIIQGAQALGKKMGLGKGGKNPAMEAFKKVNQARMTAMLTGLAPVKSLLGNIGSHGIAALEKGTTKPLQELGNVGEHIKNFKQGWQQGANPAMTGGMSSFNIPGRVMGAADYAAVESLKRSGLSQAEAQNILMTEPNAASQALGLNTELGEMAVPFRRIPFNQFKEGMTRYKKHPLIYAGAAGLGVGAGALTDDPEKIALLSAMAGPYALPVVAGATFSGGAKMTQGISPIPEWGLTRTFTQPWSAFSQPPGMRWLPESTQKAWEAQMEKIGLGKKKRGAKGSGIKFGSSSSPGGDGARGFR